MSCKGNASGSLVAGLIIVIVGVILLLGQLGFVDAHTIFRYWPAIFCLIGIGNIVGADQPAQRIWGGFLVFFGALLILHQMGYFHFGISQLWPLFLIGAGLLLIWQHYETKRGHGLFTDASDVQTFSVFGGSERKVNSKDFTGGNTFAIFGGFQLDLSQADMAGEQAVIDSTVVFGGGEIRVPRTWTVIVKGVGIFGGYSDETKQETVPGIPSKTLIVKGMAIFGGVEVKN